jgi:hypothetical protein
MMEAECTLSIAMRELLPFKHLVATITGIVGLENDDPTTFKATVWENNNGALTLARMELG